MVGAGALVVKGAFSFVTATGGTGADATAQSSAMNSSAGPVLSSATAIGGVGGSSGFNVYLAAGQAGQAAELPPLREVSQRMAP